MAGNLKKFVNPRFLKTIDPKLMRLLFERHFTGGTTLIDFEDEGADLRSLLAEYFDQPVNDWSEGLVADLHRIAELGTSHGLDTILSAARRQKIKLFNETDTDQTGDAPTAHDPKHVALHVYLHHHELFEVAADQMALRAATAMAEFRGPERDVPSDFTEEIGAAFEAAAAALFTQDLQGGYCRLAPYEEDDEFNLVLSHGAPVKTTPVVAGDREEIITVRAVKYAALRYDPTEGRLLIGGVLKSQQVELANLFAIYVLARPGFFAGDHARDLYTLDPISAAGPDFTFEHRHDETIHSVTIVSAAADLFEWDEDAQASRHLRSWVTKDINGALRNFVTSEVDFRQGWRLSEITFQVFLHVGKKKPAQSTVRLKPPGTLAFRRTRFEKSIHMLIARNGLEKDHDSDLVVEAAE
jgi:hypothetical protein